MAILTISWIVVQKFQISIFDNVIFFGIYPYNSNIADINLEKWLDYSGK
ncbi:MAG: hypothetical protein M9959_14060 [Chitinophagaceae bacterium]|nr:hypothetical protein [Chitinophagaceae bacterium]